MCILFLYHALEPSEDDQTLDLNYRRHPPQENAAGVPAGQRRGLEGRYKLIVASNRDEFLDRPTAEMNFWEDGGSNLLAGRDLHAGGTWLGVSRCGKFASVTNIQPSWQNVVTFVESNAKTMLFGSAAMLLAAVAVPAIRRHAIESSTTAGSSSILSVAMGLLCAGLGVISSVGMVSARRRAKHTSRGQLVTEFLQGTTENAEQFCKRMYKDRRRYEGFNLVVADSSGAWVLSNRDKAGITRLPRGLYGVSNATLEVPWAKLLYGKSRVLDVLLRLGSDPTLTEDTLVDLLMDVLADERHCPSALGNAVRSGSAGWKAELERICVPPTRVPNSEILSSEGERRPRQYGTRSCTVVLIDVSGRIRVVERNLGGGKAVPGSMQNASRKTFEFCDI